MSEQKEVIWLGSTKKDISKLPKEVKTDIGFTLNEVQKGDKPINVKALKGKDLKGVYEIKTDLDKNTYRAVYVVNLGNAIYMLHVFQKKSNKGIATPQPDMEKIKLRLKLAKEQAKNDKGKI